MSRLISAVVMEVQHIAIKEDDGKLHFYLVDFDGNMLAELPNKVI